MLKRISSSLPSFKSVTFQAGLNVLLSDKSEGATEKQTRNSAGKTSLIEIIHFLHGSNCDKDSLFRTDELIEHSFHGEFLLGDEIFKVSRSGSDPSKILITEGGEGRTDLITKVDKPTGRVFVSLVNWKKFLGHVMFDLPTNSGTVYDDSYTPSFRSMFSYFARARDDGGFESPEANSTAQQRWDWQVNLSYLLGLDWEIPFAFHSIRQRERTLEELKKASKQGVLGQVVGTVAELRPQLAVASNKAELLRTAIKSFEVHDSYKTLSRRAAKARTEMQGISRQLVSLKEYQEHLLGALSVEKPPQRSDIAQLYEAAGVELPGVVLRRFEDVSTFYTSVVANRRAHLANEIAGLNRQIDGLEREHRTLDTERSMILQQLEGRGALDDFLEMQKNLAELDAQAASLTERYKAAEILEGEGTKLQIDRARLKQRLQEDHRERANALSEPILLIAETISALYDDHTGGFVVDATENGPEFKISIEGDRGGGISNMEIFCFDLALFKIVSRRFGGTEFLIHDSHLFDGVDERQVATALDLGKQACTGNLQYIVTMNSDIFDRLPLPASIEREKVVLKTRLSDTETGGLFGFRFG